MTWYDVEYTFLTPTGERKALAVMNTFEPPPHSGMKMVRVRYRRREGLAGTPGEWVEVKVGKQTTAIPRARAVGNSVYFESPPDEDHPVEAACGVSSNELAQFVAERVNELLAAEREACARMVEDYGMVRGSGVSPQEFDEKYGRYDNLATAIRARGRNQ